MKKKLFILKTTLIFFFVITPVQAGDTLDDLKKSLNRWEIVKAGELIAAAKKEKVEEKLLIPLECEYLYKKGRFREAADVLRKLDNPDTSILGEIAFLTSMDTLTRDFISRETPHFFIRVHPSDKILLNYLAETLETAFGRYSGIFNIDIMEKIPVEIYPASEAFNIASTLTKRDMEVSHAVAICKYNRLMMITPRAFLYGFRWRDTIAHELVHYFIQRKTNANCPIWLHEGTADYLDMTWRNTERDFLSPTKKNLLKDAIKKDDLIPFKQMEPSLVKLSSVSDVEKAFAEVSVAVDMIYKLYSPGHLQKIFEKLGEGVQTRDAIKMVLGLNFTEFEKKWKDYLKTLPLSYTAGAKPEKLQLRENADVKEEDTLFEVSHRNLLKLARRFERKKKYKFAEHEYKRALKSDPYNAVVLTGLGRLYQKMELPVKALAVFRKLEKIKPNFPPVYTRSGKIYFQAGDYKKALHYLKESNEINPFDPEIHRLMSEIYKKTGNEKSANQEDLVYQQLTNP